MKKDTKYELMLLPSLHVIGNMMINRPKLNPRTMLVEHPKIRENFLDEYIRDFAPSKEAAQDMLAIHGRKAIETNGADYYDVHKIARNNCKYCEGYGWWPDSSTPLHADETKWCYADVCVRCGSNNHDEYEESCGLPMHKVDRNSETIKSVGFYNALSNVGWDKRCAESLDTQEKETQQK